MLCAHICGVRFREAQICKCNVVLAIRVGRVCVFVVVLLYMLLSVSVSAPTSSCPIHSSFHSRHVLLFLFIFILHSTLQLYTMFHFPHNPYFIVHTTYFVASVCLIHSTLQFILISLTCSLNQHFLCVIHYVLPPH